MSFQAIFWLQFLVVLITNPGHILTKHVSTDYDAVNSLQDDSGIVKRSVGSTKKSHITMNFQHGMRDLIVKGNLKTIEKNIPAFFATLTSGNLGPNYAAGVVKFNDISINVGNGYNPNTGKFAAPVDGIYEINYSVLQQTGYSCYVRLVKESVKYSAVHANHKNHDQLSKTVLVLLKKNQNVWVDLPKSSSYAIYGRERYTTFSGHLIH